MYLYLIYQYRYAGDGVSSNLILMSLVRSSTALGVFFSFLAGFITLHSSEHIIALGLWSSVDVLFARMF